MDGKRDQSATAYDGGTGEDLSVGGDIYTKFRELAFRSLTV
jgi:hypothetical protein